VAGKLNLDPRAVRTARRLAAKAGRPVVDLARSHTTVSVERAVLRLAGVRGADSDGIPWVNRLVDAVVADVGLGHGVALPVFHAMRATGVDDVTVLAQKAAAGAVRFDVPAAGKAEALAARRAARRAANDGLKVVDRRRAERDRMIKRYGDPQQRPWIYLIVATGDIYEDIPQAQAAR
jgi:beta-lysine 5,6-aminomutase alpha subunit